jgi:hypothetical protein
MPCQIHYNFISKQETSSDDSDHFLEVNRLKNKGIEMPSQYETSLFLDHTIEDIYANFTRETIEKLYKIYFADIILFDYSIDKLLEIVS